MTVHRGTATVLTAMLVAGAALADHPGALWSVDRLEVRADGATAAQVGAARLALMQANDTYFYGDRAVRMVARVSGDGTVRVDVLDAASGETLVRDARLENLARTALAWMDKLDCAAGRCGGGAATQLAAVAGSVPAAAPKAMQPVRTSPMVATTASTATKVETVVDRPEVQPEAQPEVSWPRTVVGVLAKASPVPRSRPGANTAAASGLVGLRKTAMARNPDPVPDVSVPPIRLSRLSTRGLGPISYDRSDRLVVGEPRTLAPATTALPKPQAAEKPTLLGRLANQIAALFGIGSPPSARPKAIAATPAPKPVRRISTYAPQGTPLAPAPRWQAQPKERSPLRLAALDQAQVGGTSRLPAPAALATGSIGTGSIGTAERPEPAERTKTAPQPAVVQQVRQRSGIRRLPSPGLGLPRPASDTARAVQVTPIRLTSGRPATTDLAVKIHPDVFNRYSTAAAERLFGNYGRPNAPVRLVSDSSAGGASVDGVLARRGLALDAGQYAKAERIFWSGRSGSRGFWISLPTALSSEYVLVASSKASVIANIYRRGATVQVSDAVAKALGLAPGQWSDVQVIALKPIDRTASAPTSQTRITR